MILYDIDMIVLLSTRTKPQRKNEENHPHPRLIIRIVHLASIQGHFGQHVDCTALRAI